MTCNIQTDLDQQTLQLAGELTIFTAREILQHMHDTLASVDELYVDLGEITEVDTAGLQLMLLAKLMTAKTVRFCNHPDCVLRLIDLANLGQILGDPLIIRAE